MSTSNLKELIEFCRKDGIMCPQPRRWNEMWELLPNRKRTEHGWEPALPLILAGWNSPALAKMLRLEEHIRWAEQHGVLQKISVFFGGCELKIGTTPVSDGFFDEDERLGRAKREDVWSE